MKELARAAHRCLPARAVDFIPHDGVLDIRQVNTNLVGAAGERMASQPTEAFAGRGQAVGIECLVACGRRPAPALHHCHALALARIAADGRYDLTPLWGQVAIGQRQIGLLDRAVFELGLQGPVGAIILGHQDQARGVFVQPVHDTRASGPPTPSRLGQ